MKQIINTIVFTLTLTIVHADRALDYAESRALLDILDGKPQMYNDVRPQIIKGNSKSREETKPKQPMTIETTYIPEPKEENNHISVLPDEEAQTTQHIEESEDTAPASSLTIFTHKEFEAQDSTNSVQESAVGESKMELQVEPKLVSVSQEQTEVSQEPVKVREEPENVLRKKPLRENADDIPPKDASSKQIEQPLQQTETEDVESEQRNSAEKADAAQEDNSPSPVEALASKAKSAWSRFTTALASEPEEVETAPQAIEEKEKVEPTESGSLLERVKSAISELTSDPDLKSTSSESGSNVIQSTRPASSHDVGSSSSSQVEVPSGSESSSTQAESTGPSKAKLMWSKIRANLRSQPDIENSMENKSDSNEPADAGRSTGLLHRIKSSLKDLTADTPEAVKETPSESQTEVKVPSAGTSTKDSTFLVNDEPTGRADQPKVSSRKHYFSSISNWMHKKVLPDGPPSDETTVLMASLVARLAYMRAKRTLLLINDKRYQRILGNATYELFLKGLEVDESSYFRSTLENRPLWGMCVAHTIRRQIYITFEGSTNKVQWYRNFAGMVRAPFYEFNGQEVPGVWIHTDFQRSYHAARKAAMAVIGRVTAKYPDYEIIIAGHSLGGVVAEQVRLDLLHRIVSKDTVVVDITTITKNVTAPPFTTPAGMLAAYNKIAMAPIPQTYLAVEVPRIKSHVNIQLLTFGSPRLGGKPLNDYMERIAEKWRKHHVAYRHSNLFDRAKHHIYWRLHDRPEPGREVRFKLTTDPVIRMPAGFGYEDQNHIVFLRPEDIPSIARVMHSYTSLDHADSGNFLMSKYYYPHFSAYWYLAQYIKRRLYTTLTVDNNPNEQVDVPTIGTA